MAESVGLYIYKVFITEKNSNSLFKFRRDDELADPNVFVQNFFSDDSVIVSDTNAQRSWHITDLVYTDSSNRNFYGILRYGMYGYESTIVDMKTQEVRHHRKTDEADIIPLVFHFWAPEGFSWAYISLQSHGGRSCVGSVQKAISAKFEKSHPKHKIRFTNISPSNGDMSSIFDQKVKKIRLIKGRKKSDRSENYSDGIRLDEAKIEVSMIPPRGRDFGLLSFVRKQLGTRKTDQGSVVLYDDQEFDQAVAEVQVGSSRRTVGIFGYSRDAGMIDITSDIKRWSGGHPVPEEVYKNSNDICVEIHKILSKKK